MIVKTILWVVGEPGVGKTAFVRAMLSDITYIVTDGLAKWTTSHDGRVVAAGHYIGRPFDGGDTISYSGGQATCSYWWNKLYHRAELTILDGDRLSNDKTIDYFRRCATPGGLIRTVCCMLVAPEHVTKTRRDARGPQNEVWVKGRKTKAKNFFAKFGHDQILVNSGFSLGRLQLDARTVADQLLAVSRSMGART